MGGWVHECADGGHYTHTLVEVVFCELLCENSRAILKCDPAVSSCPFVCFLTALPFQQQISTHRMG